MKKLCLLMLSAIALTGCGGGTTGGGETSGNGKQNFILDPDGNIIPGTFSLMLLDVKKANENFAEYCKNNTLNANEKEAYKFDIDIMSSRKLCDIVYDTDKTGSFSYSFNMETVFKDYLQSNYSTINSDLGKLIFCFQPKSSSSIRHIVYSNFSNFKINISYVYNLGYGKGIRNVSRTKVGTKNIFREYGIDEKVTFKSNAYAGAIYYDLLEGDEDCRAIDGDTTFTFSGTMTAKITD